MGQLLRRTIEGDELLAEWSRSDLASINAAEQEYRRWVGQDYQAVQSSDGVHYEPLTDDRLPVDAEQVILTTALGGG